jgi:hypothetical protein
MPVNGKSAAMMAGGAVLVYTGAKGYSILQAIQNLVKGKSANTGLTAAQIGAGNGASNSAPGPADTTGDTSANQRLGQLMAAGYGWQGTDWLCLRSGWQEESGWSTTAAYNKADPYNSAYGIPQANPGTKMASAGADWKTNPATQIKWGLAYIHSTYGSPSQVPHWTPTGPSSGYVGY